MECFVFWPTRGFIYEYHFSFNDDAIGQQISFLFKTGCIQSLCCGRYLLFAETVTTEGVPAIPCVCALRFEAAASRYVTAFNCTDISSSRPSDSLMLLDYFYDSHVLGLRSAASSMKHRDRQVSCFYTLFPVYSCSFYFYSEIDLVNVLSTDLVLSTHSNPFLSGCRVLTSMSPLHDSLGMLL
ncbi:hypothetical protein MSAN_01507200 [Mycena sanguinolenta]|uniref:Uncharacterized protein n=1 Tax=Mycena sanguinolenta TaxID=230812 RepID=A0A8H6Y7U4_9AGAR|nr:hypothetical protein MSAN_01507200 [Mycena sanguinolenta]